MVFHRSIVTPGRAADTDGTTEIAVACEDLEWVLGWVLFHGARAEVLAPQDARAAKRDALKSRGGLKAPGRGASPKR